MTIVKRDLQRRQITREKLHEHEVPIYFTSFPRLGAPGVFLDPHHEPDGDASRSFFLPDQLINPHVRFPLVFASFYPFVWCETLLILPVLYYLFSTLTANIRRRRESKVAMNMPIFHDTNTPRPFIDPSIPWDRDLFPEDKSKYDLSVICQCLLYI